MAKMKELVMNILEQYEDGIGIKAISDTTGLPADVVFDILQRYGDLVVEGDMNTTVQ
jgi:hypothetical protein